VQVTCPDKTTFANSNALDLFSCSDGGFFGGLPGTFSSDTPTSVTFGLVGSTNGSTTVFSCRKP